MVLAGGGLGYYSFVYEEPARYRPINLPPPPPEYTSLADITLMIPEATSTLVTLDMVYATPQIDYPSGRFSVAVGSTTKKGQLVIFDRYAHEGDDGLFAAPIGVLDDRTNSIEYYLAILEGPERTHTMNFPIGDDIDLGSVKREGDRVTVQYRTFDVNQRRTDRPSLSTEAVFDIATKETITYGANVRLLQEAQMERIPRGIYTWVDTTHEDDTVTTAPTAPAFTVEFDAASLSIMTDCNEASASYTVSDNRTVEIGTLKKTERFCTSETEGPFFDMIDQVDRFAYSAGELFLYYEGDVIALVDMTKVQEQPEVMSSSTDATTEPDA